MTNITRSYGLSLPLLLFCAAFPAPASATPPDPISVECLSCHDGSGGPHVRYCLLEQKDKGCGGHIISAVYDDIAARDKGLRPTKDLPYYLIFYEGKITCVTCHGNDPHSGQKLIVDNTGSVLCRSCHLK